jgi:low affinity Fe/Cu permease
VKPTEKINPVSRAVHRIDRTTSRPATAVVVAASVAVFAVVLAAARFPASWQTAFATVCAGVTTVMVFTLQHTQSREQAVTQLKLDELIRALPEADDHFVQVESGADDELAELEHAHRQHHLAVRDE